MIETQARDVLIGILDEGIDIHRCAAAAALSRFGGDDVVAALCRALLDEDPDVRTDAATALGSIRDPASAKALMENLQGDPESDVKKEALEALIAMRHAPVKPLLREIALHRTDKIVWDDDEFYAEGWDDWLDLQYLAIKGIGEFGDEQGIEAIARALDDPEGQDITEVAIEALIKLGKPGAQLLKRQLRNGRPAMRRRIARALGGHAGDEFEDLLEACLEDSEKDVRLLAVQALAAQGQDNPRLLPLLEDPEPEIRAAALRASTGSTQSVLAAIEDESPIVRRTAYALMADNAQAFDAQDITGALKQAFADDIDISVEAANAWAALDPADALPVLGGALNSDRLPEDFRFGLIGALARIGFDAIPYLRHAAKGGNRRLRLAALTQLAEFASADPSPQDLSAMVLLEAFNGDLVEMPERMPDEDFAEEQDTRDPTNRRGEDPDDNVTTDLAPEANTLDAILAPDKGPSVPAPEPKEGLSSEDQRYLNMAGRRTMGKKKVPLEPDLPADVELRRYAANLLGNVVIPLVTRALLRGLEDDDRELRSNALAALINHLHEGAQVDTEAALSHLSKFLSEGPSDMRLLATRALGLLPREDAEPFLVPLLDDQDRLVRLEAVRAFARPGGPNEKMTALLDDEWPAIRLQAARALAANGGEEVTGKLIEFAFSAEGMHRREAGQLLGEHAPTQAARAMLDVLADESRRRYWLVAIEVLDEIFGAKPPGIDRPRKVA